VTSVDWFGGTLLAPLAPVGAAVLAESEGPAFVFVVAGSVTVVVALAGLLLPSIRDLE
jgi:hypothetical protein